MTTKRPSFVLLLLLLLLVLLESTGATARTSSLRRSSTSSLRKAQHHRSLGSDSNDNGDDDDYNGDYDDSGGNFITQFMNRMKQDAVTMWGSSPSTWITEYWEVFGAIALVAFLIIGCHCFMCVDICCNNGGSHNPNGRKVMTQAEMEMADMKKKEAEPQEPASYAPPSCTPENSNVKEKKLSAESANDALLDPVIEGSRSTVGASESALSSVMTEEHRRRRRKPRRRRGKQESVLTEVVDVWREFLGFKKYDGRDAYSRYEDAEEPPIVKSGAKLT